MKHAKENDVPKWAYAAFFAFVAAGFLAITYFGPML
jgi:hypothetical protein